MRPPELRISHDEIIVDNFAGGGGASLGIEMALGRSPDIAINHDRQAIEMHRVNHPNTEHYCEDVWKVDPLKACRGRPVGLAWFSPDCKHFSKAKGGKPVDKKIRGLAWVVVRWAKEVRPRVIMLENVEEFAHWGPIGEDGRPCPLRKGFTFRRWKASLQNLGYVVEHRELVAAEYGAPTTRKRLFLVARCDGQPIVWPKPTHGRNLLPYRTAAECIDWSLPTYSIFLSKEEGKQNGVKRPLAENTMRRIARGLKKFVLDNPSPFVVSNMTNNVPRPATEPLTTVLSGNHKYVVDPYLVRTAHGEAGTNSKRWGKGEHDVDAPVPTVTGSNDFAVVCPFIAKHYGGEYVGHGARVDGPLHTITSDGNHQTVVTPFITKFRPGSTGSGIDDPLKTITAGGKQARPGTGNAMGLVAPVLVPRYGERLGQEPRALTVENPMPTIVPTQNGGQLVSAFLAKHYGGHETPGSQLGLPLDTVTARDHNAVVASSLVKLKGTCKDGQEITDPLHTVQAGGTHYAEVRAFFVAYYGNEKDGGAIEDPFRTLTAKERFGLITVHGESFVIADIGMRMLAPRELYRAQGFPDSYQISPVVDGKPLPKDAQVRMVGNSVCPPLAAAMALAQFSEVSAEVAA